MKNQTLNILSLLRGQSITNIILLLCIFAQLLFGVPAIIGAIINLSANPRAATIASFGFMN